jgi:hypothetical protein
VSFVSVSANPSRSVTGPRIESGIESDRQGDAIGRDFPGTEPRAKNDPLAGAQRHGDDKHGPLGQRRHPAWALAGTDRTVEKDDLSHHAEHTRLRLDTRA